MEKSQGAFRTISEVADALETPAHVLRFWESRFPQIKPVKRAGGRRYYRPADVALLAGIKRLLHDQGVTIRGVQKILREEGVRQVCALGEDLVQDASAPDQPDADHHLDMDGADPGGAALPRLTDGGEDPTFGKDMPPQPPSAGTSADAAALGSALYPHSAPDPAAPDPAAIEALTDALSPFPAASAPPAPADHDDPMPLSAVVPPSLSAPFFNAPSREPSAEVIAFPGDTTKEIAVSDPDSEFEIDPRQIFFPGFEPSETDLGDADLIEAESVFADLSADPDSDAQIPSPAPKAGENALPAEQMRQSFLPPGAPPAPTDHGPDHAEEAPFAMDVPHLPDPEENRIATFPTRIAPPQSIVASDAPTTVEENGQPADGADQENVGQSADPLPDMSANDSASAQEEDPGFEDAPSKSAAVDRAGAFSAKDAGDDRPIPAHFIPEPFALQTGARGPSAARAPLAKEAEEEAVPAAEQSALGAGAVVPTDARATEDATLAARLRAAPKGSLDPDRVSLLALSARIGQLLQRMVHPYRSE